MNADDDGVGAAPHPPPPWQQALLDDMFLLMTLGLVVPTLLYIVWGLLELSSVPLWVKP